MISLGSVIGAGLVVGSSAIIHDAGPRAFIAYLLAAPLVLVGMRMLGEVAVVKPTTGSFMSYARIAMGNWANFSTGWLYWHFWVIVVGFEAVVGGQQPQAEGDADWCVRALGDRGDPGPVGDDGESSGG